jgi:hypothetical protein
MSTGLIRANDAVPAPPPDWWPGRAERVLVVYREGRQGAAALRAAAALAETGAELSVVTLAPQAKPLRCCKGGGAGPYNCAVKDAADEGLDTARTALGTLAARASFTRLVGTPWPPLAEWSAARRFDVAIVPRDRFARGGGQVARELRAATKAEVRLAG